MFFLLRLAFWLGIVLFFLPSGAARPGAATNAVGASDTIAAASATVGDLRQFCRRQPGACTVGSQVATEIGHTVQLTAKTLYGLLTEALARSEAPSLARGSRAGSQSKSAQSAAEKASQNTLKPADLAPAWRRPPSRNDGKVST
jgi:hypothetical protein